MIYSVRHLTRYRYASPVGAARCVLRLRPTSRDGQAVLAHAIDIEPRPTSRTEQVDYFGLPTTGLTVEAPHRELTIVAKSRIEVTRDPPDPAQPSPGWESVRDAVWATASFDGRSPVHFVHPSRRVPLVPDITAYARESFPAGRPLLEGGFALMNRIRQDFTFDARATHVATPLGEAFAARRGVCQDFTHIMVAGLRGLGLPAAYVSGYLRTVPPPGVARLRGADVSHAWAALWDGTEWLGLDPTNGIGVGRDHIILAMGRDYSDISPVDGIILASGPQRLQVEVDVVPDGEA